MTRKSELNVSLGAMTFGEAGTKGAPLPASVTTMDDVDKIVSIFQSHGHAEIDTAIGYTEGTSEKMLGRLGWQKRGLKIATKIWPPHSEEVLRRSIAASLKSLQAEETGIDLYYWHALDRKADLRANLELMDNFHKAGYFERWGLSNSSAAECENICKICDENGWIKPSVHQGSYNPFLRGAEDELFPMLRKLNMAFYAYSPLAGGLMTGRHSRTSQAPPGSRFDADNEGGKIYQWVYYKEANWKMLDSLQPVADKHNLTLAEIGLRWMSHHSAMKAQFGDTVIIGASSARHIEQNMKDLEKGPLPQDILDILEEGWKEIRTVALPYYVDST